ncbi:hypothetical protein EV184_13635 [Sinorhizobium americanum]|uniref:Uncharacterized protein n=1 Tax=Sinorhizobium americanum TaxID=194963 RepID=A0A4R2AVJ7_9HYPH|nr:hypothetical protein EV184_13635 [Sinorhizobium americanum]
MTERGYRSLRWPLVSISEIPVAVRLRYPIVGRPREFERSSATGGEEAKAHGASRPPPRRAELNRNLRAPGPGDTANRNGATRSVMAKARSRMPSRTPAYRSKPTIIGNGRHNPLSNRTRSPFQPAMSWHTLVLSNSSRVGGSQLRLTPIWGDADLKALAREVEEQASHLSSSSVPKVADTEKLRRPCI